VEFFRGMRGSIHVAFEEGTQAQWLHDLLRPIGVLLLTSLYHSLLTDLTDDAS
jgi:hypothetical protein